VNHVMAYSSCPIMSVHNINSNDEVPLAFVGCSNNMAMCKLQVRSEKFQKLLMLKCMIMHTSLKHT
jgi:hypothetical protein